MLLFIRMQFTDYDVQSLPLKFQVSCLLEVFPSIRAVVLTCGLALLYKGCFLEACPGLAGVALCPLFTRVMAKVGAVSEMSGDLVPRGLVRTHIPGPHPQSF